MKIWLVNHYAITPEQTGGTRHFSFAKRLQERGHEVAIIASSFDHFSGNQRAGATENIVTEVVDGVTFVWVPTRAYVGNGKSRALNMVDFARNIKRLPRTGGLFKPDVVLGSSPHLFTPYVAQKLARKMGVPFVLEIRDVWPQTLVDLGNFSATSPMIRVLAGIEKKLYRTSDAIVSLLPSAGDHMVALGADKSRVNWIPNGVDLSFACDRPEPPANECFTVTYAGTHGLANGLDTVLDAAKILADEPVRFRLIGDGPERPRLIQRAADEAIQNVVLDDPVPKSQVYAELAKSDAFVMLLKASDVFRWGVSPNKLFDYMASKRPVIFAVNSSNSPVESAGCGVRIAPEDPEALAAAVRQLAATDAGSRRAMGEHGAAYVAENHSFDRLTDKLEAVLKSVVKS